jgi:Zn-finger nucleic acid-binding protein
MTSHSGEADMLRCPFCGGPCGYDVRACPHCSVELASVRCPRCFSLHFTGSRFCARCGTELELEPLLEPTEAPCPRCQTPLAFTSGAAPADASHDGYPLHECVSCGGLFLSQGTFEDIVRRESSVSHPLPHAPRTPGPSPRAKEPVVYLKCPMCHDLMNRVNFGKRSGVIVEVCKPHGVWFEKGELTRAIEFVADGGLVETKRRDEELAREKQREAHVAASKTTSHALIEGMDRGGSHGETLLEILRELLS